MDLHKSINLKTDFETDAKKSLQRVFVDINDIIVAYSEVAELISHPISRGACHI
jgi:hypothetical protein